MTKKQKKQRVEFCKNILKNKIKGESIFFTDETQIKFRSYNNDYIRLSEENEKRLSKGLSKRRTRALVVGIPNVGKSTLINRLVNKKVTNVGNKPGVTKNLNWIRVGNSIELLDTPGILWPKLDENNVALNLASLTAIKEEILPIDKVVVYILNVLNKYYNFILKNRYGVDYVDSDIEVTLDLIGKKFGCLMRGGIVDYDKVFTIIINDIKTEKIKGITFDRYE